MRLQGLRVTQIRTFFSLGVPNYWFGLASLGQLGYRAFLARKDYYDHLRSPQVDNILACFGHSLFQTIFANLKICVPPLVV